MYSQRQFSVLLSVAFLSTWIALPCAAEIKVGTLTKSVAKEKYGITMHAEKNGDAGIKVWLQFKKTGWLEKFTYAELIVDDEQGRHMVTARLQPNPQDQGQPADVTTIAFSARQSDLDRCKFLVVCYNSNEGDAGYYLNVKDFIDVNDPVANTSNANDASLFPHWAGEWEVSDEVFAVLGFDKADQHSNFDFPDTLKLSIDPHMAAEADEYGFYRQMLEKNLSHTIITSAHCQADPKFMELLSTRCLITKSDGGTYLWFTGVPFIGVRGGKVSFVEGRDRDRDLLIIDFNLSTNHESGKERGEETVVYKRKR